jgi:hypothetical protein
MKEINGLLAPFTWRHLKKKRITSRAGIYDAQGTVGALDWMLRIVRLVLYSRQDLDRAQLRQQVA